MRALFPVLLLTLGGCTGLDRLIDGSEDKGSSEAVLGGWPMSPDVPVFNIPTPDGYTLRIFHGLLTGDKTVALDDEENSIIKVFIRDAGQWFVIGTADWAPFYYERIATDRIKYYGTHLANNEYCVYQYVQ